VWYGPGIVKTLTNHGGCESLHQKRVRNTHFISPVYFHHCNLLTRKKQQVWNRPHSTTINKIGGKWTVNAGILRGGMVRISGSGRPRSVYQNVMSSPKDSAQGRINPMRQRQASILNMQTHPVQDNANLEPFLGIICDGDRKRSRDLNDRFITSSEHFQR